MIKYPSKVLICHPQPGEASPGIAGALSSGIIGTWNHRSVNALDHYIVILHWCINVWDLYVHNIWVRRSYEHNLESPEHQLCHIRQRSTGRRRLLRQG